MFRATTSSPGATAYETKTSTANCKQGEVAVGGGAEKFNLGNLQLVFMTSRPTSASDVEGSEPTGWRGSMATTVNTPAALIRTYVVCASP